LTQLEFDRRPVCGCELGINVPATKLTYFSHLTPYFKSR